MNPHGPKLLSVSTEAPIITDTPACTGTNTLLADVQVDGALDQLLPASLKRKIDNIV
jgi:hypothetical protein